jgi:hypothetical protein
MTFLTSTSINPPHCCSGPGFYINSYLILLSVYVNLWMLLLLALTGSQKVRKGGVGLIGRRSLVLLHVSVVFSLICEIHCIDSANALLGPSSPPPCRCKTPTTR